MRSTMERIWLKAYPPGVPADIDSTQYRSLPDLLDESFKAFAPRHAFACMGRTLTYAELDVQSRNLGAWLQSKGLARRIERIDVHDHIAGAQYGRHCHWIHQL